jgi:uroporphyrinogen-III synthase
MHLLVTRPEPDAERTASVLRARGHRVTIAPLLRAETIPGADFGGGPFAAVVMTSANAARAIADHPRREELLALPVFTVGRHTAEAAGAAGFSNVASADGGWRELVRLVASKTQTQTKTKAKGKATRLLYLPAERPAGDVAGVLTALGRTVETVVLYRTVANPDAARQLRAAFADAVDGVLHYSPRSAQAFLAAARSAGALEAALKATHYCLSAGIAAPLDAAGATMVRIARRPKEAALVELLSFR